MAKIILERLTDLSKSFSTAGKVRKPVTAYLNGKPYQTHKWVGPEGEAPAAPRGEPKNTVTAYKLFRVNPKHPGKLFPLFVDADKPVPFGEWVDATAGAFDPKDPQRVKSKLGPLAYRPGWHAGRVPVATHIGLKNAKEDKAPSYRNPDYVWAEVTMPNDVDWQAEAERRAKRDKAGKIIPLTAHITDRVPAGGYYSYKTNSNMTGEWMIGGAMKVNRVLTDAEVEKVNAAAGFADLPRTEPLDLTVYGFDPEGKPARIAKALDCSTLVRVPVTAHAYGRDYQDYMYKSLTFSGWKLQGRRKVHGMDISIENRKGSTRRGTDADGHEWATKMHADYGYIRGTVGKDKDHVDAYVGPNPESTHVFIIHQNNPATGAYDEDKVMLGFDSAEEAKALYLKQYDRPGFFGSMEETDVDTFKAKAFAAGAKGKRLVIKKSVQHIFGVDPELVVGIMVEKEHTDDPEEARKIALDHIAEVPDYYSRLIAAGLVDEPGAVKAAKKLGLKKSLSTRVDGGIPVKITVWMLE